MRSRKALIEKLRLKNSTLKVQKKKLQLQLKQKEEMGEVCLSFHLKIILLFLVLGINEGLRSSDIDT